MSVWLLETDNQYFIFGLDCCILIYFLFFSILKSLFGFFYVFPFFLTPCIKNINTTIQIPSPLFRILLIRNAFNKGSGLFIAVSY